MSKHWWLACVMAISVALGASGQYSITTATYTIDDASESLTSSVIGNSFSSPESGIAMTVDMFNLEESRVIPETCPAGSYSESGSSVCTNCPAGSYSQTSSATALGDCISCDAGKYSNVSGASRADACINCHPGKYSVTVGGSSEEVCLSCPVNSYSAAGSQALTGCVCDAGFSGPNGGPCAMCGINVWCLNGKLNPCPLNSVSPAQSGYISQCLCKPGFYGDASVPTPDSATICSICKENHFCPGGAVNYTVACADGKYSLPGSDDVGDCKCPDHAVSRQMSSESKQCVCQPGYYKIYSTSATLGGWRCEICLPGQFCYDNVNKTCPPFSSSDSFADDVLDCYCRPGFANASIQTETTLCVDCPENHYCYGGGHKARCVDNAVSPSQSVSPDKCFCDWGWEGVKNQACVKCVSPTFCYNGILAQCPEGSYSEELSWDVKNCSCVAGRWGPPGGPCVACAAGKYKQDPGCSVCTDLIDSDCLKCADGTASNTVARVGVCDLCPGGSYSGPVGSTACVVCPIGTFSTTGSKNCTKCTLGWWAPPNSTECTPCPKNTYLDVEGKGSVEDCIPCPLGTVSAILGNSDPACSACPVGTFQLEGVCTACPAGKYSSRASVECSICPVGTYSAASASICTECDAGSYAATNGSTECELCTPGAFAEFKVSSSCTLCTKGYYTDYEGAEECEMCNRGLFSPEGSSEVCLIFYSS